MEDEAGVGGAAVHDLGRAVRVLVLRGPEVVPQRHPQRAQAGARERVPPHQVCFAQFTMQSILDAKVNIVFYLTGTSATMARRGP